jgi:hypothetical protein
MMLQELEFNTEEYSKSLNAVFNATLKVSKAKWDRQA